MRALLQRQCQLPSITRFRKKKTYHMMFIIGNIQDHVCRSVTLIMDDTHKDHIPQILNIYLRITLVVAPRAPNEGDFFLCLYTAFGNTHFLTFFPTLKCMGFHLVCFSKSYLSVSFRPTATKLYVLPQAMPQNTKWHLDPPTCLFVQRTGRILSGLGSFFTNLWLEVLLLRLYWGLQSKIQHS